MTILDKHLPGKHDQKDHAPKHLSDPLHQKKAGKARFQQLVKKLGLDKAKEFVADKGAKYRQEHPSSLEKVARNWFEELGESGNIVLDAKIPGAGYVDILHKPTNTAFEVDGAIWHTNHKLHGEDRVARDAIKEQKLAEAGYRVVRLGEQEMLDGSARQKIVDALYAIEEKHYPQPVDPTETVTVGSESEEAVRLRLISRLCKVLDLPKEVFEEKHLPGRHDQKTHAGDRRSEVPEPTKSDVIKVASFARKWKKSEGGIEIPDNLIPHLIKFSPKHPETLYRGIRLKIFDDNVEYDDNKKTYEYVSDNEDSWTTDRVIAEMFMISNGSIPTLRDIGMRRYAISGGSQGIVIKRTFEPEEMLFSFDVWQDYADKYDIDTSNMPMFGGEGEVITLPKSSSVDVVSRLNYKQDTKLERYDEYINPLEKHLPGRHDQKDHGKLGDRSPFYEKEKGAESAAKKLGGVVNKIKNAYTVQHPDANANSAFAKSHHIRRETVGVKEITKTLKSGEKKKVIVPVYKFYDSVSGKEITNKKELERLNKSAPPGVEHVRINPDPNGYLISSWTDSVGRSAAMRSKQHTIGAAAEKFERLKQFHKALPEIRKQIEKDVASGNQEAEVLYLIDKTGFRAGSGGDTKAAKQAYGASTLLNKHVKVDGDKVTFDFIGKKGVRIKKSLRDETLAKIIQKRKTSKYSQRLFNTNYGQVMKYLKSVAGDYKIHDFRTHNGTTEALKWIKKRKGPASSEKEFAKWQREVAEKVGTHLGNNRSMALNSYIDPHVWDAWRQPEWGQWVPKSQREE